MLEHNYREIRLRGKNNTKRKLVIEFADEKYELLAEFLMGDMMQFRKAFENELDAVLDGQREKAQLRGNKCHLVIFPDYVVIYDETAEDGLGNWCQVDMDDFLDAVNEWDQKTLDLKEEKETEGNA